MELIIKPKNIVKLDKYIKMGANAFLFGMKSFSINQTSVINTKSLLYLRKKYNKGIKIYVSFNRNFFNKDLEKLKKLLIDTDKIGIDGILFYDLAVFNICKELNLKTPLIWNQNYFVTNYETCNYYYEESVSGAIVSSEITLDEIKEIANNTKMNLYINAFGYQQMSYSKRKLISNYLKYIKTISLKKYHYIFEDNRKYLVQEEKNGTLFLSDYVLNSIKEVNDLKECNIKGIILDERMINHKVFFNVLGFYNSALSKKNSNKELNLLNDNINRLISNCSSGFLYKSTVYKVK